MVFIRTATVVLVILQLALLAAAQGRFNHFNNNNHQSTTTSTYVDNEICERNGLLCGNDSRSLRMTRCCEIRRRSTGRFLRYRCCNPELTGLIVGVIVGSVLLIGCCIGFCIFGWAYYLKRKNSGTCRVDLPTPLSRRPIFKTQKPLHARTEALSYNDVYEHTSFSGQNGGNVEALPLSAKPPEQLPSYDDIVKDTKPDGHCQSELAANTDPEKETVWTDEPQTVDQNEEDIDIQYTWRSTT